MGAYYASFLGHCDGSILPIGVSPGHCDGSMSLEFPLGIVMKAYYKSFPRDIVMGAFYGSFPREFSVLFSFLSFK